MRGAARELALDQRVRALFDVPQPLALVRRRQPAGADCLIQLLPAGVDERILEFISQRNVSMTLRH